MAKELGYSFDTTRLIDNFLETLNSTYATTSFSSYPPSSVYDELRLAVASATSALPPVWPLSVTDKTIVWQGVLQGQTYDIHMSIPETERGTPARTVGHIGASKPTRLWQHLVSVEYQPPAKVEDRSDISFLCDDYGNTNGSEVFDTTGHSESGVDPRTGLFHAHYPVASLQGLQGLKKPAAQGSDEEEPNKAFHELVLKTLKAKRAPKR
ncbi:hypothetical protein ACX0KM_23175 [Pseudomonas promysalinigenes]